MDIVLFSLLILLTLRKAWAYHKTVDVPKIRPLDMYNASKVIEDVLAGYRDEVVPIINGEPVNVEVNLFINDMMPINKADMHFSLDCYLRMAWMDPRLSFNASSKSVFIPFEDKFYKEIWTPNLYFPYGKSGFIHLLTKPNIFVKVHSDGRVFFSERLSLVSFCAMNMSYYPFDIQRCHLAIEDYSNPVEYVRLNWMKPATEKARLLYSTDFAQIKLDVSRTVRFGDFNNVFDRLVVEISLYRDIKLFILRDFLPCILIVMMSWITFWINYNSIPARVCLGITTVLTTVSMTNSVQKSNPVSDTLRSLDIFLLICLLFVFGALLELAITGMADRRGTGWWKNAIKKAEERLEKNDDDGLKESGDASGYHGEGKKKSKFLKTGEGIQQWPVQLLTVRRNKGSSISPSETKLNANTPGGSTKDILKEKPKFIGPFVFLQGETHIVDRFAKVFFPSLFFTFLLIFFLFHYLHPDTVGGANDDDE